MIIQNLKYSIFFLFLFCYQNIFSQNKNEELFQVYLIEAQKLVLNSEFDTAKVFAFKALDLKPNSSSANYFLSTIFLQENNFEKAKFYADIAYELNKNNIWYIKHSAYINLLLNNFETVENLYFDLLKISKNENDFLLVADFYRDKNEFLNEIDVLNKFCELFYYKFEILSRIISVYELIDDYENMIFYSKKIVNLFPENPESYLIYADKLDKLNKTEEAYYQINKAISLNNTFEKNNFYLAMHFSYINNIDSTFKYIKTYLKSYTAKEYELEYFFIKKSDFINPNVFNNYYDSITSIIVELYPTYNELLKIIAETYLKYNNFYKGIYFYEINLEYKQDDYYLYNQLCPLYTRFSMWTKLDSLTSIAFELFPAQPYLYLFRGISLLNTGKYNDAFELLSYGNLISFDNNTLKSYFTFYLSEYYRLLKDKKNEDIFYENTSNLLNGNCDLIFYFAFYYAKYNINIQKSLDLIGACILNNTTDLSHSYSYIYSYVLYKYKDFDLALTFINSAIEFSEYPNFLYYELKGNILNSLGKTKEANDFWNESIKLGNINLNKQL